jgi:hypothetical protein
MTTVLHGRATAGAVVLVNPESRWRYAISSDEGIVDGALPDGSAETPLGKAQQLVLRHVEA